ncbi:MAG: L-seryl-tRNA(Sec) selenium transferase, partial [Firmicutes bacterium]|nr:L-seryl-tRNA(Sec) selenium transferase [Bacillota bacterium]
VGRMVGYCNLELSLETGKRGSRYAVVEGLLRELTGAEAALVVNNNAAAVLLALAALARGREVVVSRGQLIEIGGSFRMPDVMAASGARLVEVGTTNKTYPEDYRRAVGEHTALLLWVHTSNYRIVGFTREVAVGELVALGRECGLPVMCDLGSGSLVDLRAWGLPHEPTVQEVVAAGADVVTFSGDKLLGGPQAGIVVGRAEYVGRMKAHPLTRAVRVDKLTLAALEATLREYRDHREEVHTRLPVLRMLTAPRAELERRARALAARLAEALRGRAEVATQPGCSRVGGGALPTAELPAVLVTVAPLDRTAEELRVRLRQGDPPVVARVREGRLLLDLRTVPEEQEPLLELALARALA